MDKLLAAGAPGRAARRSIGGSRQTLLGRRTTYRDEEPAWPVGRLPVDVGEGRTHGAYEKLAECGVTRDGHIVLMDPNEDGRPRSPLLTTSWTGPLMLSLSQLQQIADRLEQVIRELG
jgi:hypothetical protein